MGEDGHTLTGDIRRHADFPSRLLGRKRDVLVYLPPGYKRSRRHYPVLYLFDGQNVFDAATAYVGVAWEVDDTAERLIRACEMGATIIVAVDNAQEDRIHEYTPTRGEYSWYGDRRRSKGQGARYGKFLIEELKPFIDMHYRTRPEGEFTGLCGSSLGGLMSLYLGLKYPKAFQRLGVLSPSIWWDDCVIYDFVEKIKRKPPLKIWLDTGTAEEGWERARVLREKLIAKGWMLGRDLHYHEAGDAGHTESAWAARIDSVLKFLYPSRRP